MIKARTMSKTNTIAASNSTTADDIWEIKIANQVLSQQALAETEPLLLIKTHGYRPSRCNYILIFPLSVINYANKAQVICSGRNVRFCSSGALGNGIKMSMYLCPHKATTPFACCNDKIFNLNANASLAIYHQVMFIYDQIP